MTSLMIHQPEFMPWTNLFTKMACCDKYVFLDSVQYLRRSYQNRNRLKYQKGQYWLTVPLQKANRDTLIKDILIDNSQDWQQSHKSFLTMAYKEAPFFEKGMEIIENIYENKWDNLCDLNCYLTEIIAHYIRLNNSFIRSSELSVSGTKSDRILNICLELKADRYICGTGSKSYLEEEKFNKHGIKIVFLKPMSVNHIQSYPQLGFIEGLSIIDYLFNVGVEKASSEVKKYKKEIIKFNA